MKIERIILEGYGIVMEGIDGTREEITDFNNMMLEMDEKNNKIAKLKYSNKRLKSKIKTFKYKLSAKNRYIKQLKKRPA